MNWLQDAGESPLEQTYWWSTRKLPHRMPRHRKWSWALWQWSPCLQELFACPTQTDLLKNMVPLVQDTQGGLCTQLVQLVFKLVGQGWLARFVEILHSLLNTWEQWIVACSWISIMGPWAVKGQPGERWARHKYVAAWRVWFAAWPHGLKVLKPKLRHPKLGEQNGSFPNFPLDSDGQTFPRDSGPYFLAWQLPEPRYLAKRQKVNQSEPTKTWFVVNAVEFRETAKHISKACLGWEDLWSATLTLESWVVSHRLQTKRRGVLGFLNMLGILRHLPVKSSPLFSQLEPGRQQSKPCSKAQNNQIETQQMNNQPGLIRSNIAIQMSQRIFKF